VIHPARAHAVEDRDQLAVRNGGILTAKVSVGAQLRSQLAEVLREGRVYESGPELLDDLGVVGGGVVNFSAA
jgi:hypothetical protein